MNYQAARRGAAADGRDDQYADYGYDDYQLRPGHHHGEQGEEQEYDPRAYAPNPDEPYGYDDDGNPLFYEPERPHLRSAPRSGFAVIAAVLAVACLGGAGAVAYKMMAARGLTGGEAPLIKADSEPVKTVPEKSAADAKAPNKAIYDRVESSPAKSKVVSREEEPVDLPSSPTGELRGDGARTIVPGGADRSASGGGEEPRRVKTMTIRPDASLIAAAQPVNVGNPAGLPPAAAASPAPQASAPDPIAETARTGQAPRGGDFDNGIMADQGAAPAPKQPAKPAQHVASNSPQQPQLASTPKPAPQAVTPPAAKPAAPATASRAEPQQVAAVAPRAPVAAAPTPAKAATGGFVVQVTSQRSEQDARTAYASLQKKFPQVLGSYQASIQSAAVGDRGTYYRVRVGPFGNSNDASTVCNNLRAAGGDCVVSRN